MRDLSRFYELLASLDGSSHGARSRLEAIIGLAREGLHSEHAGVMLLQDDGFVESVAVTDHLVTRGDDLQRSLQEGPCLSAIGNDAHIELVPSTRDDPRWPRWGPAADSIGIRSVLSVRLSRGVEDPIGSLNVYNQTRNGFDDSDVDIARVIGDHAMSALIAFGKLQTLARAVTTRTNLGQAQGVLMTQYGITADEAFEMMRRSSEDHRLPLGEVAEQVVRKLGLATPPDA